MNHPTGPFSIPAINNFIPEKIKPWLVVLLVVIIQFSSGGVYLSTAAEMVGGTALMQQDILMAGYASLSGMALVFAYMLRFKMRFTSKFNLLISLGVLAAAQIICVNTTNMFILVATCFIAGGFRMLATFECNSTLQLWLTPKRDLNIFFCFIGLLIQSSILLSGSLHLIVAHAINYQFVYWLMLGLLLFAILFVITCFNNNKFMPAFPLFGIDWFGGLMWGLTLLSANFMLVYGDHYDWFYAQEIQSAFVIMLSLLALNLIRAAFIRHPFIPLQTFKFRALWVTILLLFLVEVLISPGHLIEHILMENVLGYDGHHVANMSLYGWVGVIAAAVFCYFYFAKAKHSYKSTFMIGFMAIVLHLALMYFFVDYHISKHMIGLAILLRCFGYTVIEIVLLSNLLKIPFPSFFHALSVQAFMSAALGSSIGGAILHHLFKITATKNFQLLSANADHVNTTLFKTKPQTLEFLLQGQVLMVTFKEIYGLLLLIGFVLGLCFVFYKYPYLPNVNAFPKWSTFRRYWRKDTEIVKS